MAQQPNYGALSDYNVEQSNIERARKYAELMQAQGAAPIGQTEMVGGWALKKSPFEGLAKVAQSVAGGYGQFQADERQKALAERLKTERDQADNRVFAAASGSPNLATDPTRLATARPQWMTDAQPDLVPTPPSREEIRRNTLAAAMSHPDMRGPALAAFLQQQTANPESAFAKIDPSKFTADSVAKFAQSGNHAVLVPRDKMDFQNIGGSLVGLNPFTGAQGVNIATSMKPGEVASNQLGRDRLGWDQYQFGNLSENQRQNQANDRARLANQGIETQFNTGQGVGAPLFAGLPQNAPMQFTNTGGGTPANTGINTAPNTAIPAPNAAPRPAMNQSRQVAPQIIGQAPVAPPQGQPQLTPRLAQQLAFDKAHDVQKGETERTFGRQDEVNHAKKILSAIGFNPETETDNISKLIKQSTSGHLQNMMAQGVGAVTGSATSGREAIGKLSQTASQLTMDLMGGKLGSGISNADRDFVVAQLGNVDNANIPANERLSAWKSAVDRLKKTAAFSANYSDFGGKPYTGEKTNIIPPQGSAARGGNVMEQADQIISGGRR